MLEIELAELVNKVEQQARETQTLVVKAARQGVPSIYDTLSAFSNQPEGGTILFGVDESAGFKAVGVYNVQDLQVRVREMCEEM